MTLDCCWGLKCEDGCSANVWKIAPDGTILWRRRTTATVTRCWVDFENNIYAIVSGQLWSFSPCGRLRWKWVISGGVTFGGWADGANQVARHDGFSDRPWYTVNAAGETTRSISFAATVHTAPHGKPTPNLWVGDQYDSPTLQTGIVDMDNAAAGWSASPGPGQATFPWFTATMQGSDHILQVRAFNFFSGLSSAVRDFDVAAWPGTVSGISCPVAHAFGWSVNTTVGRSAPDGAIAVIGYTPLVPVGLGFPLPSTTAHYLAWHDVGTSSLTPRQVPGTLPLTPWGVDADGNVAATGSIGGDHGGLVYVTSEGETPWYRPFVGGITGGRIVDVIMDCAGDMVVAGARTNVLALTDYP